MPTPLKSSLVLLLATFGLAVADAQPDSRRLVELPPMMQEHMLGNMRDHLRALEEVLSKLAKGEIDEAGWLAEKRIGMSSLEMHGASHMAPYMPEGMRAIGTEMHRATSRFAKAAQEAELENSQESRRKLFSALQAILTQCNACHSAYRIR
ncbi:MAG: hypothetical protein Kow006_05050 [Gammaproteobacteria bacterium]